MFRSKKERRCAVDGIRVCLEKPQQHWLVMPPCPDLPQRYQTVRQSLAA
jgi:hypothetical protein